MNIAYNDGYKHGKYIGFTVENPKHTIPHGTNRQWIEGYYKGFTDGKEQRKQQDSSI